MQRSRPAQRWQYFRPPLPNQAAKWLRLTAKTRSSRWYSSFWHILHRRRAPHKAARQWQTTGLQRSTQSQPRGAVTTSAPKARDAATDDGPLAGSPRQPARSPRLPKCPAPPDGRGGSEDTTRPVGPCGAEAPPTLPRERCGSNLVHVVTHTQREGGAPRRAQREVGAGRCRRARRGRARRPVFWCRRRRSLPRAMIWCIAAPPDRVAVGARREARDCSPVRSWPGRKVRYQRGLGRAVLRPHGAGPRRILSGPCVRPGPGVGLWGW